MSVGVSLAHGGGMYTCGIGVDEVSVWMWHVHILCGCPCQF